MIISLAILTVTLAVSAYIWFRNSRVHDFRNSIVELAFSGNYVKEKLAVYDNGPSYNQMVLSFKPLKLESFYTQQQIYLLHK